MGRVLHNWNLAQKNHLLKKAYDALAGGGVLIVYERLIDDERRANTAAFMASLNMLVVTAGGFDYSGADCTQWMTDVGFRNHQRRALDEGAGNDCGTKVTPLSWR
jgi:hypothetical protein